MAGVGDSNPLWPNKINHFVSIGCFSKFFKTRRLCYAPGMARPRKAGVPVGPLAYANADKAHAVRLEVLEGRAVCGCQVIFSDPSFFLALVAKPQLTSLDGVAPFRWHAWAAAAT